MATIYNQEYFDNLVDVENNYNLIDLSGENIIGKLDLSRFTNTIDLHIDSYCSVNPLLTEIILPPRLLHIVCMHTQITEIKLPETIKTAILSFNRLKELHLPPSLKSLLCMCNQLTELKLPPSLEGLHCIENPLIYNFDPTIKNINEYNRNRAILIKKSRAIIYKVVMEWFLRHMKTKLATLYHPKNIEQYWNPLTNTLEIPPQQTNQPL